MSDPRGSRPWRLRNLTAYGVQRKRNQPRNAESASDQSGLSFGQRARTATTAAKIAGAKWNAADTYYTIRNKVIPGNIMDPAHIEKGMGVWLKK